MSDIDIDKMKNGELFAHFINLHKDDNPTKSYNLYQDLKVILALKDHPAIQSRHFKEIEEKQIVKRSYESIKSRYTDFLQYLTEEDYNQIASFIREHQNLNSFLIFENKKFVKVSNIDPKSLYSERKRQDDDVLESRKKVKTDGKKFNDPTYPKNEFDKFSIEDLDQVLQILAEHKSVPKAYLVEKLHQLSGNLDDLEVLLNTNDETHCFIEEEDLLLKDFNTNRQSTAIKLLVRKKQKDRIQRRLRFLGLQA